MKKTAFVNWGRFESLDCGAEYTPEQVQWMLACHREMRRLGKTSLTCRQILALAKRLGYRKVRQDNQCEEN